MNRNSVLLSIGATLFLSLFFVNGSHAFQLDMDQTANLPTKQVSNTPSPCAGRTAATCRTQSQPGSGATATDGSRYTSASMLVLLPAAGILFGGGLLALVGLGARRLRHPHGHHA